MKKAVKGLVITAAVVAGIAVLGSVAMGGFVASQILNQNEGKDTHGNSLKQLEIWEYDIDAFNSEYEGTEISAVAEDGNEVPATYFDSEGDECVILVHGAGGDRVSVYPLAQQYLEDGYDIIAIDQRGCGENPDANVTFGINESLDVKAMVRYAREELCYSKVIVHGQSMGAQTVAIYAASVTKGDADAADAVICDSPVPGMELMLREMFGEDMGGMNSVPVNYLIATSRAYMSLVNGIDYDDADTIALASQITIPVLIIVSQQDEICLPDQVEQIYDNITVCDKEIVYVSSAHIEGVIDDSEGYMNSVESFLADKGL